MFAGTKGGKINQHVKKSWEKRIKGETVVRDAEARGKKRAKFLCGS